MGQSGPQDEDLRATAQSREAARRAALVEQYVWLLRKARAVARANSHMTHSLDVIIRTAEDDLAKFRARAGGRIEPRRRSKHASPQSARTGATVYLDECGGHSINSKDAFGAFVLGAVIVADNHHDAVDQQWKRWKASYLGGSHKIVHEPDIRRGNKSFWCDGNAARRHLAITSLPAVIRDLDFRAVAVVINRSEYRTLYGTEAPDETLPEHAYLMSLAFMTERLVFVLDKHLDGRRARVVAESRGPREDAMLQAEFARLHLDGTSYVSAAYIRQHLEPGIRFMTKDENSTGLQLADLLARPCGDKVLAPETSPDRWEAFRAKLCEGQETRHSILGLKIFPWNERYDQVWTSEEGRSTEAG